VATLCIYSLFNASSVVRAIANSRTARRVARRVGRAVSREGPRFIRQSFPQPHEESVRVTKKFRYILTDTTYQTWNFSMRDLLDSWVIGQTATSAIRMASAVRLEKITLRVPPLTFTSAALPLVTPTRFIWQSYSASDPDGNRTLSYDIVSYGTNEPAVFSCRPPAGSLIEGWINASYSGVGSMFTIDKAPVNSMLELTISYVLATGGVGQGPQPGYAAIAGVAPGVVYVRTLPASSSAWVPIGFATA
jgi:hypothetical protein